MKTSNIIITAFAILIVSGMLFLFIDAKDHKKKMENNFTYKEFPLSAFKVVVAEKGSDLHIDRSDSTIIKVEFAIDKKTPSKLYKVSNDTLYVYGGLRMFVKCKNISAIIGNNPFWVGVFNINTDSLTIRMNGGKFVFNIYNVKNRTINQNIFNIGIIANDSARIEIRNAILNNLTLRSDNAVIINYCNTKHLNAKLKNKARIFNLNHIETLIVEKDTTSQVEICNQNYTSY